MTLARFTVALATGCLLARHVAAESRPPGERRFQAGMTVLGGATLPVNAADWIGYGTFALDFLARVSAGISLGVRLAAPSGIGVSQAEGPMFQMSFVPTLELSTFLARRVEPFVDLGVLVEASTATALRPGYAGAAPVLTPGVRLYVLDWLSVAPGIGVYFVATDHADLGSVRLGRGAVAPSGSIRAGLHF